MSQLHWSKPFSGFSLRRGLADAVFVAILILPAARADVVPVTVNCEVWARSDYDSDIVFGSNYAYREVHWNGPYGYSIAEITCANDADGDASIRVWAQSTGVWAGGAGTYTPRELTIGTSDEYPAGSPLLLDVRLETDAEQMYTSGGFDLMRGSTYLIDARGQLPPGPSFPPSATYDVVVYAGEVLTPDVLWWSSRVRGDMDLSFTTLPLPEPGVLTMLALGAITVRCRRG